MNILHTETLKNWGGGQNKVLNEMKLMRELGHKVFLFANPNAQIAQRAENLGFEVILCEMSKKTYHQSIPKLFSIIKDNNIHCVITHDSTDSWVGAATRILCRLSGIRTLFMRERHNLYPIKGFLSLSLHRTLFDKILYISEALREYLEQIGVPKSKLFYLPSTLDTTSLKQTQSNFREEFGIAKDSLVIGTFTSLYPKKGVYDFAQAAKLVCKEYPNAVIVFGGGINEGIKEQIQNEMQQELKGGRVIFTGWREDALNVIKAFDVYVFASHTEGLGTVLLEAMCSCVPIVVYDKPPMSHLIAHKQRGLCAAYLDAQDLSRQILHLIAHKEESLRYAKEALEYVCTHHDHTQLKGALENLLTQVAKNLQDSAKERN